MIIGPCFGYIIQCVKMVQEKNADGFSPLICLILLSANIIRVFWWVMERFSLVILLAAILMIICQLALLYLWVQIRNSTKDVEFVETATV